MTQRTGAVKCLLFLTVTVTLSSACSQSLWYFYTAATPGLDFTEYTAEGWLDGEQFVDYDSKIRKLTPKPEWKGVPDSWESEIQNLLDEEKDFKDDVVTAMQSFNNTDGVHTVKWMYGCELDDDGTGSGYWQCGYDGKDCFSLKIKNGHWIAETPQSKMTKLKWEETEAAGFLKAYLQNDCISRLHKFVNYRKSTQKTLGSRKCRSLDGNTGCKAQPISSQEHEASGGGLRVGIIIGVIAVVVAMLVLVGTFLWKKKW